LWQRICRLNADCLLENEMSAAHIPGMAEGWNITTRRPDPKGGTDLVGAFVVRVSDPHMAVALVQSKMPDATVKIDTETSPEVFERYDVKPGEVFVLVEGK
jgi:hypothetical protein